MTALRESAMRELERLPEDKIKFVLQIMQGVNGLYQDSYSEKKKAFERLEQLRRKGTVTVDDNVFDDLPVGILSEYADSQKRLLEEGAFERAMVEKHGNG